MAIQIPRFAIVALTLAALLLPCASYPDKANDAAIRNGLESLGQANYALAAEQFRKAADLASRSGNIRQQIQAVSYLADTLRAQGRHDLSIDILEHVRPLAETLEDPQIRAALYGRLGAAYTRVGAFDQADALLYQATGAARDAGDTALLAALLNDQGNLLVLNGKLDEADAAFRASIAAAVQSGNLMVEVGARNNLVRSLLAGSRHGDVADLLAANYEQAKLLPDTADTAQALISIGALSQQAQRGADSPDTLRRRAYAALQDGLTLARRLQDLRLESFALGYIGRLYEDEGRLTEAARYTDRAVFLAQSIGADDSLYLWEWQSARLLRDSGDIDKALLAYKQSINSLQKIRTSLMYSTYGGFKQKVGPLFLEYADLLIRQSPRIKDPEAGQNLLREVRLTLEQSKVAEVEEYFQDQCVVTEDNQAYLDRVSPGIAVIYPLLLPDRTEILVSFPDGIHRYTSPPGEAELTATVRRFRAGLESALPRHEYLPYAQTLYRWVVAPMEAELDRQKVDTLVFVPDGSLRSIPLSALHDGHGFLIERYAVATTPGLTVTNPETIDWKHSRVLLNGITEAVQGFPALPSVAAEIASVQALFPDNTTLEDQSFLLASARDEISEGNYSVVHLATHGQFDSDHRKSFLLAYDGKLTMQRLSDTIRARRYQGHAIELLVLSACQTAAGDDRAALGLAGVAVQAGAHSALASLWFIDDAATADLIAEFYAQLKSGSRSRAQALRQAQLSLLHREQYRHPAYWAPFLLIGNWQ